jgi:DNA-binding GntR family transcriptional regulator
LKAEKTMEVGSALTKNKIRMELTYFDANEAAESVAEHEEILRALREGDLERAMHALEINWQADVDRLAGPPESQELAAE